MIEFDPSGSDVIETVILRIEAVGDKIHIFPRNTNLRPRFGSQLEDRGRIFVEGWQNIDDTVQDAGQTYHIVDASLKSKLFVGSSVLIRIDKLRRLNLERMHSAIHLLCSLIDADLMRGYAGDEKSRVEFAGDFKSCLNNMSDIRQRFSEIVNADLPVRTLYLTNEEVRKRGGVKEFDEEMIGNIRVIEFEGMDTRVCLGTHVRSSGEIGDVEIVDPQPQKDGYFKISLLLNG